MNWRSSVILKKAKDILYILTITQNCLFQFCFHYPYLMIILLNIFLLQYHATLIIRYQYSLF